MSSTATSTWTPSLIADLLDRNSTAVERAMIALFNRQTLDEKVAERTRHRNGCGFSAVHARRGTYYARWCLSGRRLDGRHLERARRMAKRYTGQLCEIAQAKGAARQPQLLTA